jgi:amino acid permease
MHHLPQTIIMMIATYGLIYFISQYFIVIFIIGPLILYIDSFIFARILKQYMPKTEEARIEE